MYQALYRKWRPRNFEEISGQQHITKLLQLQCKEDRVSHAYLFCGTRGTGKTSTAKILAKAVNCEQPVDGNPCNCCFACKSIDSGNATDVLEIDAASNNGVDDIRDLRDEVVYPPSMLKKRVYIIDEVHMLSSGAFNALLKTLEEPPEYIVFILATTELNKLPATIISRCIRFDFSRLSEEIIADRLRYVAKEEQIGLGQGAAELLARLADGALRDGLSIMEACTASSGEGNVITAEAIRDRLGIADGERLLAFYRGIATRNVAESLAVLEEVHDSSKDLGVFLDDLSSLARDLLVLSQVKGNVQRCGTFRFEKEASSLLTSYPQAFSAEALFYYCSVLDDTMGRISRYSTNKKILLEFAAIRMCDPSLSDSAKALMARVARLERQVASGAVAVSAPIEEPVKVSDTPSAPEKKPPAAASAPTGEAFAQYADLMEEMMGYPDLLPYVQKIKAVIENGVFVVISDGFTVRMLQLGNNAQHLADAVRIVTGKPYKIEFRERTKEMEDNPLNEL